MKRRAAGLLFLVLVSIPGFRSIDGQQPSSTEAAQTSTEAWLLLIDNENYAASWDAPASLVRARITQKQWEAVARAARAPFGPIKSRTLKSVTSTTTLPGAPDGEYVVFQFNTSFARKSAALETVTAVRESDSTWHVVGYFIK